MSYVRARLGYSQRRICRALGISRNTFAMSPSRGRIQARSSSWRASTAATAIDVCMRCCRHKAGR